MHLRKDCMKFQTNRIQYNCNLRHLEFKSIVFVVFVNIEYKYWNIYCLSWKVWKDMKIIILIKLHIVLSKYYEQFNETVKYNSSKYCVPIT